MLQNLTTFYHIYIYIFIILSDQRPRPNLYLALHYWTLSFEWPQRTADLPSERFLKSSIALEMWNWACLRCNAFTVNSLLYLQMGIITVPVEHRNVGSLENRVGRSPKSFWEWVWMSWPAASRYNLQAPDYLACVLTCAIFSLDKKWWIVIRNQ